MEPLFAVGDRVDMLPSHRGLVVRDVLRWKQPHYDVGLGRHVPESLLVLSESRDVNDVHDTPDGKEVRLKDRNDNDFWVEVCPDGVWITVEVANYGSYMTTVEERFVCLDRTAARRMAEFVISCLDGKTEEGSGP